MQGSDHVTAINLCIMLSNCPKVLLLILAFKFFSLISTKHANGEYFTLLKMGSCARSTTIT